MGDAVEVRAENLGGESILEAPIRVMKKVGDTVSAEDVLFIVETDKTSLEISAPVAGVLTELRVADEEVITKGQVLAIIRPQGEATAEGVNKEPESKEEVPAQPVVAQAVSTQKPQEKTIIEGKGLVTPTVEDFVAGINTTPTSRALGMSAKSEQDKKIVASQPSKDLMSCHGDVVGERRVKMSKIRQVIAARLKESQNTSATLSTFNEVDMSKVMELRAKYKDAFVKRYDVKLGFMSFFIRAVVLVLSEIPVLNAEISGDDIVYRDYCNIGVAVGTDKGLVVPVIRRAETMSLAEMEQALVDLSTKARSGKLSVSDMSGATFTITNGGVYGSLLSTPIINPPQSGILGMHAIQQRPVAVDGKVEIRPMMYLALSYDHRIVDGQGAVTFLVRVKQYIEDPNRLALGI
ncbi:2-oxoglutarate dehydrogenase complex dihydrolipoyllysine-residue succinyltransferase [Anaplasma phagocytophilum]|uniref:Dihydrolipoyllysine-residue succinyltransferase n=3 Tax=Anaplasma phagocytophilum TaxID=948 RepID=Q2GIS0_ANAPZ|nr:2-oxoglutarate dehydrogenase complex dihydrolipoyllysine-residue succinyltransferase [Anaplasma phagocytophilum]KJZ99297.1 dihydrolipoyllysine-residue succinyltransferase [Anaplasma phagocytophilum str. CR1007]ABD43527.1 2-oxoglutarate dehydrogenase, E2 component, dihydrolipoamide succinyltransferase [Anaplasma phagocytophilum str. HZ]AGR79071.1 dihydrolipoamide succinyltransferase [Anaplasma phagocytophilum str. HZ2]AGR80319.1 dihydrolipoamide succinyltransferase [Anaplasma phagocytophilum 